MTIARATLRHLLRRKWKLPLAVFVCGVVLVGLHHAYDVNGIRESYSGAIREHPDSRSPEQVEAIATWNRIGPIRSTLDAAVLIGPFLVGLLMPGGVVANERGNGAIMLWAQHPMSLTRFYMVLPFLIFPTRTIDESAMGFGSTGVLLYHFALWTAVAWMGLRRLERRPLRISRA